MTPGHKKMPRGRKTVTPGHEKVTPGHKKVTPRAQKGAPGAQKGAPGGQDRFPVSPSRRWATSWTWLGTDLMTKEHVLDLFSHRRLQVSVFQMFSKSARRWNQVRAICCVWRGTWLAGIMRNFSSICD